MAKKEEVKKMTLEEYEEKYSKPVNTKNAKTFLYIFAAAIGIIVFFCLFSIVTKVYEMNEYAGYASIAIAVLVFIFVYIVPLVKICKTKAFITNVDSSNARSAQKYNRALRNELADKIIDLKAKTEGIGFYSDENVGKLAIARNTGNEADLKNTLTKIYDTDVRSAANKMIREHAIKVGVTTALSQNAAVDTLFVTIYDLNLIKDIIFLYGFRPSDAKLAKIYKSVISNALLAYGASQATSGIATSVISKVGESFKNVPLIGIIGTAAESVTQGLLNATLTVKIGMQTKAYLKKEYNLQNILDEIDLSDEQFEEDEAKLLSEVKADVTSSAKESKAKKKEPVAA